MRIARNSWMVPGVVKDTKTAGHRSATRDAAAVHTGNKLVTTDMKRVNKVVVGSGDAAGGRRCETFSECNGGDVVL